MEYKVYSSKPRGEEWYMSNNPNSDPRFHLGSFNLVRNEDGSFKVTSTEIRLGVYTSTGYDQNKIAALDQGKLTQKDLCRTLMTTYNKRPSFSILNSSLLTNPISITLG